MSKFTLDREDMELLVELQAELDKRSKQNLLATFFPQTGELRRELYPKHMQFYEAGAKYRQRLFLAANRVGKTTSALIEIVYHASGLYPIWWKGKRFADCSQWWLCGKDSNTVRGILQDTLLGPVGSFGTGIIPAGVLDFDTLKDAKKADTPVSVIRIKHINGTYSTLEFKTYDSGRQSFEGTAKSILMDEEPPMSIYTECLLRTMTGGNILISTFTPLKGISEVVLSFLGGTADFSAIIDDAYCNEKASKFVIQCGWGDVPHLSEEDQQQLLESIPPFQRDARSKGIPQLGAGAIYPVPESEYTIAPFEIPKHFKKVYGMDVGWNRTAVVWGAIDPDSKILYLYSEHYKGEAEPSVHATAIRSRGEWIQGVIDSAANGRSQVDGDQLMQLYRDNGLKIQNADKSVETGLYTCWELLSSGQIKVFNTCNNFLNEIRLYRRDEKGKIIKSNDHLMDAWRYLVMSGRDIAKSEVERNRNKVSTDAGPRQW